jgi:hypothetical protein
LSDHPRPSPAAAELLRGGCDPHVHIAPDVMERRIDDLAPARRFQRELAAREAYLERCFTTAHTGKCTWDTVFEGVRAATPARSFFASDLGQPFNPPIEDGLALMADRFLAAGFTADEVHTMAVTNTVALAGSTS